MYLYSNVNYICTNKKKSKIFSEIFLFILCSFLAFIFAYRELFFPELMGYDYYDYINWFNHRTFENMNFQYKNFGFDLLICICKSVSTDYHLFLFVCGFICCFFILKFIKNNSSSFVMSFTLLITMYYFSIFNGMRQYMACSIFLGGFNLIKDKHMWKYFIIVIIASLFHDSAILLLLLYPLLNINREKKYKDMILAIGGVLAFIFFNAIISFLLNTSELFGLGYSTKYENVSLGYQVGNFTNLIITIGIYIIIKLKKDNKDEKQDIDIYVNYLILAIIFSLLSTTSFVFNRLNIYFSPSILICMPLASNIFLKRYRLIFNIFIIIVYVYTFLF